VKVAYQTEATIGPVADETRVSADVEVHNSNSWGGSSSSDTTMTSETGITLTRPSGDSSQSYAFYPVFYTTQDGTVKVAHALSNPADPNGNPAGYAFWAS
jgi:hypothetical protein